MEPISYAKIIREGDTYFLVDGESADIKTELHTYKNEEFTLVLPENSSNRKWFNSKKADAAIAEQGECPLTYKPARTLSGPRTHKMPNERLIAYLPEDLQAEYRAIVERAFAAMDADRATKKAPASDKDKLLAKMAKLKADLMALGVDPTEI